MLPYTFCKGSLFLKVTAAVCCCFCGSSSVSELRSALECILLDFRFAFLQAGVPGITCCHQAGVPLLSPGRGALAVTRQGCPASLAVTRQGCPASLAVTRQGCPCCHQAGVPLLSPGRGARDHLLSSGRTSSAQVRLKLCCCLWPSSPSSVGRLHCLPGNRSREQLQVCLPSTAGCCFQANTAWQFVQSTAEAEAIVDGT